ncbi:hypothetical protein ACHAQH_005680 [Verticillium albo-atrum]
MKISAFVLGAIAQVASAHYFFDTNIINGAAQPSFKYVRDFTRATGDWFKIFQEGVCDSSSDFTKNAWCTWGRNWIAAKIPKNTPNGEYLFRVEHIGIHRSHVNQPEHYVSCLQIKVVNGGTGTPGPLVKFPGAYKATDAYANFSIYGGHKSFPFPGPAVWNGVAGSTAPPTTAPPSTPPSTPPPSSNCASLYGQCGGSGFTGPTCCSSDTCEVSNQRYSQCL